MAGSCIGDLKGFECSFSYILGALLVMIAIMFRKNIANDLIGTAFSVIGGSIGGLVVYISILFAFGSLKWAFIIGLAGMLIGGFLSGNILGDGEV